MERYGNVQTGEPLRAESGRGKRVLVQDIQPVESSDLENNHNKRFHDAKSSSEFISLTSTIGSQDAEELLEEYISSMEGLEQQSRRQRDLIVPVATLLILDDKPGKLVDPKK